MSEAWLDGFARACGTEPLDGAEVDALLEVARDVAHRVERKVTPLATFLLGMSVQAALDDQVTRSATLSGAINKLEEMLPTEAASADPPPIR